MILHNLSKAIREQNYYAVFIEFIIVILGVVIGFQINAWAQGQAAERSVERYLSEIADDLRSDLDQYDVLILSARQRVAAAEHVLSQARGRVFNYGLRFGYAEIDHPGSEGLHPEESGDLLSWINLVRIDALNRTGFDAMVNAGALTLIEDRALGRAIQAYYSDFEQLRADNELLRAVRNDGFRETYELGFSVFQPVAIPDLVEAVRENDRFAAYVGTQRDWAVLMVTIQTRRRETARALLADIELALEASE